MTLKSGATCVKATSRSSTARPQKKAVLRGSMPAMALFHRRELLGTGHTLISRLPCLIGHAIDGLAALVLAHRRALGVRRLLQPVGQAVAAEAGEVHQIDVLDIAEGAQLFDETPDLRLFKFCSVFVVGCHDRYLSISRLFIVY